MLSIRWRLTLTYLGVTLVSTLGLGIVFLRAVERSYVSERVQVLRAHADLVKNNLRDAAATGSEDVDLACLCRRLSQCLRTRLILTTLDGRRVVDTADEEKSLDAQGQPCAPDRFQCGRCHGSNMESSRLRYTVTVVAGKNTYLLTVVTPSAAFEHIMAGVHAAMLGGLVGGLLLMGVISLSLASKITAPLVRMSRVARRIAEGDLEQRVAVGSRDELGDLAASFNDMIERLREGMNALAEEKNKLETVLAQMADGILVIDTSGRVVVFNPACERLFGIPSTSILGQQVYGATFNADFQRAITRALAGETVAEEIHLRHPHPMVLGVHASPYRDAEGLTQGVIVLVQDRTEMRRTAELQREFVANASHELRTPVASLQATVDTLLEGAKDDPEVRDRFIETLATETSRLSALLENLLDLSRLESGPIEKTPVAVSDAVRDAIGLIAPLLNTRDLELDLSVDETLIVPADRAQLVQIVANLLDNAVKYTPDGGKITVAACRNAGQVQITVADTGVGIPREEQERIFDRFYRVDRARTRALGGTGLGLAIARAAAEAHGGRIDVESTPGRGSQFTVTLPLE